MLFPPLFSRGSFPFCSPWLILTVVRAALFDGQMCFSVFRLVTRVVHEQMRTKHQSKPPLSSFQNVNGWCMS